MEQNLYVHHHEYSFLKEQPRQTYFTATLRDTQNIKVAQLFHSNLFGASAFYTTW